MSTTTPGTVLTTNSGGSDRCNNDGPASRAADDFFASEGRGGVGQGGGVGVGVGGGGAGGDTGSMRMPVVPPPGFSGDILRASSVSAPPPGFDAQPEQRRRDRDAAAAAVLLRQPPYYQHHRGTGVGCVTFEHEFSSLDMHASTVAAAAARGPLVDSDNGVVSVVGYGVENENKDADAAGKRTTSFANLAAALGESMARSMDDSLCRSVHGSHNSVALEMDCDNHEFDGVVNSSSTNYHGTESVVQQTTVPPQHHTGGSSSSLRPGLQMPDTVNSRHTTTEVTAATTGASGTVPVAGTALEATPSSSAAVTMATTTSHEPCGLDNYQRQSRHISSRLIGPLAASGNVSFLNTNNNINALTDFAKEGGGEGVVHHHQLHPVSHEPSEQQQPIPSLSRLHLAGTRSSDGSGSGGGAVGTVDDGTLEENVRSRSTDHRAYSFDTTVEIDNDEVLATNAAAAPIFSADGGVDYRVSSLSAGHRLLGAGGAMMSGKSHSSNASLALSGGRASAPPELEPSLADGKCGGVGVGGSVGRSVCGGIGGGGGGGGGTVVPAHADTSSFPAFQRTVLERELGTTMITTRNSGSLSSPSAIQNDAANTNSSSSSSHHLRTASKGRRDKNQEAVSSPRSPSAILDLPHLHGKMLQSTSSEAAAVPYPSQQAGVKAVVGHSGNAGGGSGSCCGGGGGGMISSTERDLAPFLREATTAGSQNRSTHPSRGLILIGFGLCKLNIMDIRSQCDSFGSVESFRGEFCRSRGVVFVSYFDLRSAQRAAAGLPTSLSSAIVVATHGRNERFGREETGKGGAAVSVRYCIPLSSSAPTDESTILLSNLPEDMDEHSLTLFMESFGGVRSVHYQVVSAAVGAMDLGSAANGFANDDLDGPAYVVEFYDIQDAKLALLELQSTEPWGSAVRVEVGMRNPTKRRQAKDLLRLIGRWRMRGNNNAPGSCSATSSDTSSSQAGGGGTTVHSILSSRNVQHPKSSRVPTIKSDYACSQRDMQAVEGGCKSDTSVSPLPSSSNSTPPPQPQQSQPPNPHLLPAVEDAAAAAATVVATSSSNNPRILNASQLLPQNHHEGAGGQLQQHHMHHHPHPQQQQTHTQLVLGPDGQYSYVTVSSLPMQGSTGGMMTAPPPPTYGIPGPFFASTPQEHQHVQVAHYPSVPAPQYTYVHAGASHPQQQQHQQQQQQHHQQQHLSAPAIQQQHPPIAIAAGHPTPHVVMPSYIDMRTGYPISPIYLPVGGSNADSSVSSGSSGHLIQQQQPNNFAHDCNSKPRGSNTNNSGGSSNNRQFVGADRKGGGGGGSSRTRRGGGTNTSGGGGGGGMGDDPALTLDIEAVKDNLDFRTSLMVRNIPNKYTQKMLLEEFSEYGHGSDKMDFFYLPIDFKNKCNRGYAFVNFVDYRDIIPFHEQYNGNPWRTFNSDKICKITYARIQGKAAMLKRFEHSALLDKEDEYRPLVFISHGPRKGEREALPGCSGDGADTGRSEGDGGGVEVGGEG